MKNFFILPNNVLNVSPLVIFALVAASVNVGDWLSVVTFGTLSNPTCDFVTLCGLDLLPIWLIKSAIAFIIFPNETDNFSPLVILLKDEF